MGHRVKWMPHLKLCSKNSLDKVKDFTMRSKQLIGLFCYIILAIQVVSVSAQDAAFNVEEISSTVVRLQNLDREIYWVDELQPLFLSGLVVSSDGLIFSANIEGRSEESNERGDYLTDEGDRFEISVFTALDERPMPMYLGEAIRANPFDEDAIVVIQITHDIDGNEIDPTTLNLPHLNPISTTVTVNFTDVVFTASYPSVGDNYLTTTQGQITAFDRPFSFASSFQDVIDEILMYQSDVTIDHQGLGGPVLNFAGQFVGIATELPETSVETDDVLVQIAPITSICATVRDICLSLMERYRPTPDNRAQRPSGGKFWLEGGIDLRTGEALPRGELSTNYYCAMFGLRARTDADETIWECFSRDERVIYPLTTFDYDMICQQIYRNEEAVAIQDGSQFINPAFRWRCYG